jgi:hypothetical protein
MQHLWLECWRERRQRRFVFKRTVAFLNSLDKRDAELFSALLRCSWGITSAVPVVIEENMELYTKAGITFASLKHLDQIGLVTFDHLSAFVLKALPKKILISYFNEDFLLEFKKTKTMNFMWGKCC